MIAFHRRWSRLVGFGVGAGAILLLAAASPALAQTGPGFSLVFGVGYASGGWGPSVMESFEATGMDQSGSGVCIGPFCEPPTEYPVHYQEGIGAQIMAGFQYRFGPPVSLEVLASNGIWGHAEGNNNDRNEHLLVKYRPLILSTTAGAHLGPVRVGVGPAFNRTAWDYDFNHGSTGRQNTLTTGLTGSLRVDVAVEGFLIAGRADVQAFPDVEVRNRSSATLEPNYRSLVVGISIHPRIGH